MRRVVAVLDESASASTETQNYTEPYVEESLADEEWLQNYRKEQEDKDGLARELKSTLMSVPVSESHPPSTIFSFCCPSRENERTEREAQGVGRDMSCPRKLFLDERKSVF